MPVLQDRRAKIQNIKKHTNVLLMHHFLTSLMRALRGSVMSLNSRVMVLVSKYLVLFNCVSFDGILTIV